MALLLWAVAVLLLVLLARWRTPWLQRGKAPSHEPAPDSHRVILPWGDEGPPGNRNWLGSLSDRGLGSRGFRIGVGIAILALAAGGTGALLYARSMASGDAGPESEERLLELALTEAPASQRSPLTQPDGPLGSGMPTAVDPESGDRLILWAGDGQVGRPGRRLRESVAVVVVDAENRPVADREVRFELSTGGGELESPAVRTTASGLALTSWYLGRDPESLSGTVYLADRPEVSLEFSARLETPGRVAAVPLDAAPPPAPLRLAEGDEEPGEPEPGAGGRTAAAAAPSVAADRPAGGRPLAVPVPMRRWDPGGVHTCVLGSGGDVRCWGSAAGDAELGSGVRSVAAGVLHVCGITAESTILCRAVGGGGGGSMRGERSLPQGGQPVELAVGSDHVCARASTGAVHCWGKGERGQLGTGVTGEQREPVAVTGLRGVVQLVSGWSHTCALTEMGQLYCWGANSGGQLGLGGREDRSRPAAVTQPAPFSRVTAGSAHTCALTHEGDAWCWGENRYGQLGTGSTATAAPARVQTELSFVEIAAGGVHTCGLTRAGAAWCWGRNVYGQLGDDSTDDAALPVPVRSEQRFRSLAAGGAHTCGETAGGEIYCWGNNIQGQLGDQSRESKRVPVRSVGRP